MSTFSMPAKLFCRPMSGAGPRRSTDVANPWKVDTMEASRRGDPAASGKGTSLERLMAGFDASNAAMILSAAADITFVVNADGIVSDRVMTSPEMPEELFIGWPGKALVDLVTLESRPKIEQMLRDVAIGAPGRWRQVNHPTGSSEDLPIRYFAMRSGTAGHAVLVGRDMRHLAAMQQRLLAAEQSIEQEYARLRHAETRYRLLMQVASEAILVVEARTGRIVEANPAAASLLSKPVKRLPGCGVPGHFRRYGCRADRRPVDESALNGACRRCRAHIAGSAAAGRGEFERVPPGECQLLPDPVAASCHRCRRDRCAEGAIGGSQDHPGSAGCLRGHRCGSPGAYRQFGLS
ncbi:MAG: PAS domain-containing protein [Hyphomicrobiales bacterium]|nr:MAG: PAS domain-containing protein [Hyphomicrobiales bacterium]